MSSDKHVHISASADTEPVQTIEREFFILPGNLDFAGTLMNQLCRPDRQFPRDLVNRLYFDTVDQAQYMRPVDSDLWRHGARIRWHHKVEHYEGDITIFLELEMRAGSEKHSYENRNGISYFSQDGR